MSATSGKKRVLILVSDVRDGHTRIVTQTAIQSDKQKGLPSLGERAAHGFAFMMVQTLASKLFTTVRQIVLAWLLVREDFGLVGLAMTVSAFTDLTQEMGLGAVLIQRHRAFRRWANPAFWMTLASGIAATLVLIGAAPVAAWFYRKPEIIGLIYVLAIDAPFAALSIVPAHRLRGQMRFREMSVIGIAVAAGQTVLSIIFAAMGLGAYSIVLPRPILHAIRLVVLWRLTRPKIRWHPQLRRWRFLLGDTTKILLAKLCMRFTSQGDYMVLGFFHSEAVVGVYFFAFNLSIQAVNLFTRNLVGVLFPALSHLQDNPSRQLRAFLRASRLLGLIGVPACFLQAALADPGIRLVVHPRWYSAIPVLQILSLGMALRVIGSSSGSLLQAQGRFGLKLAMNIVYSIFFMILVTVGAWNGVEHSDNLWDRAEIVVALAASIYFAIIGPMHMYIVIRPAGGRWYDVWYVYALPMAMSAVVIGAVTAASSLIPEIPGRDVVRLVAISGGSVLVYPLMLRQLAPDAYHDLVHRLGRLHPAIQQRLGVKSQMP